MPIYRRHFRREEAPAGTGTLHDGGRYIATVTYALTVLQEVLGIDQGRGVGARRGRRQVSGRLHVTAGSLPFEDDRLTLRLDDGRSLPFFVVGAGPRYTIEPGGMLQAAATHAEDPCASGL